jgi:hypothetical protein
MGKTRRNGLACMRIDSLFIHLTTEVPHVVKPNPEHLRKLASQGRSIQRKEGVK